jgi:hypothetical protein
VLDAEGYVRLVNLELRLAEVNAERRRLPLTRTDAVGSRIQSVGWLRSFLRTTARRSARGPGVRVEPGKEGDFRYIRGWLASSEWLDRLIAATEPRTVAGAAPTGSRALHCTRRAFPTRRRRLLQWRSGAASAQLGKS